ncbi:MAG: response regulator transcription factor [Actinomycetota bacterium]|nr:response regulator transcription factor [Actinomycetota bacterium]
MPEESIGVLIVDDHRMFAQSLARLLADDDHLQVLATATTAAEAYAAAIDARPAVALVDYQMPDSDGVEITRRLKAIDPGVSVIMLTGVNDDRLLLEAIEAGCSGFLTKERAASEVAAAIGAVADGEALISPEMLARLLPQLTHGAAPAGTGLTERERQLLTHVAAGLTNRAIGETLHLSVNTVRNYMQSILSKLGAHSKLEAVSLAVKAGIIDYPRP